MKNPVVLVAVVVILLLGAGGAYLFMQNSDSENPLTSSPHSDTQMAMSDDIVAQALGGSGSIKCEYTDGEQVITAYVKNGMVRSEVTGTPEGAVSFLYKDNTTWSWNSQTQEGFRYEIPEESIQTDQNAPESMDSQTQDPEEIRRQIDEYKESCENTSVSDSQFEVPSDVNFQDFSSMFDNSQMQDVMEQVPEEYQQYLNQ